MHAVTFFIQLEVWFDVLCFRVSGCGLGDMLVPGQLIFRIRLQEQFFRLRWLARMLCAGLEMRYTQFPIFGPILFLNSRAASPLDTHRPKVASDS